MVNPPVMLLFLILLVVVGVWSYLKTQKSFSLDKLAKDLQNESDFTKKGAEKRIQEIEAAKKVLQKDAEAHKATIEALNKEREMISSYLDQGTDAKQSKGDADAIENE